MTATAETRADARGAYFLWVDILRGCAALAILVWHYKHFYCARAESWCTFAPSFLLKDETTLPFYTTFELLYLYGGKAVELFWVISGFVFAAIYAAAPRQASGREFFINRFARLYPLHLTTLIVVAALQAISFRLVGHDQIYIFNDAYHFVLNLLFASYWGFEHGLSFNGPIWSVSVEVVVYVLFFAALPAIRRRPAVIVALIALFLGLRLVQGDQIYVLNCGAAFFLGCLVFYSWRRLDALGAAVPALAGLAWIAPPALALAAFGPDGGLGLETTLIFLFAGVVLLVASLDRLDPLGVGRRLRLVGDLTYGVYLWHVPTQILLITLIEALALDRGMVGQPWFFAGFFAIVVSIAWVSFRLIETPARIYLRRTLSAPAGRGAEVRQARQEAG